MTKEDVIKSEAREFYEYGNWKSIQPIPSAQDLKNGLEKELRNHLDDDSKKIYLNELIRLIDKDAKEHLKTCKKKDNPNECHTNRFYAKSRYYTSQIVESIKENYVIVDKHFDADSYFYEETLYAIEGLLNGEPYLLNKQSPKEILEVITRLSNLGILSKNKYSYSVHHDKRKFLTKLLELKSWKSFNEWLNTAENEEKPGSVTNINLQNSSGAQVNHAEGGGKVNNPKNENRELSKDPWLKNLLWWIKIIGAIIASIIGLYKLFNV
ncbi:MAG TPA: hypothetical protein VK050_05300 [Flavobacteriaceae bacterium]|nr:hypothetical protein [Flavobacteriaceae bacterium]